MKAIKPRKYPKRSSKSAELHEAAEEAGIPNSMPPSKLRGEAVVVLVLVVPATSKNLHPVAALDQ